MEKHIKFILYARKSTDEKERQVLSLDSQVNDLRSFAKREGIHIQSTVEESRTSKQPGRPLFNDMLARIERGDANGLLCWDIDRLYRNPVDEGRVRWLLQNGVIASIRTPTREFRPEDAGLLMGVEGGRATDYIIRLARNVKRGVGEKLRRGEWPGNKPIGYIYDSRLRNIVPDPKNAKIVQTIYKEYAEGLHSLNSVSQRLFELGVKSRAGRTWSKWSVWQLLTNRLFIGIMDWKGETFEGKYKPIVTPELFNSVQERLKVKSKPRRIRNGHNFPFCGLFRCTCGSMISAQWAKGHGGLYRYYRCTRKNGACGEPYTQEALVTQQCLSLLQPLGITTEQADRLRTLVAERGAEESSSFNAAVEDLDARLTPVQKKLDRLAHAYLDELMDEETYRHAKEKLLLEKASIKGEKARFSKRGTSCWIEPAQEVISALETLGKTGFQESLPDVAKHVQKIGTNPLISRKTVTFSFSQPYDLMLSLLASPHVAADRNPSSLRDVKLESTVWCPRQDLNLYDVTH